MPLVFKIALSKEGFASMPLNERRLLFLFAHAVNEISVMNRVLLASNQSGRVDGRSTSDFVHAGQTMIVCRDLVSKLCEAKRLYEKCYLNESEIRRKYKKRVDDELKLNMENLNKVFNDGKLFSIRNKLASHYTDNDHNFERAFHLVPDDEMWIYYLSNMDGNSFYYASEMVAQYAIFSEIEPYTGKNSLAEWHRSCFERYLKIVFRATRLILVVMGNLIAFVTDQTFPNIARGVEFIDGIDLTDLRLPFYSKDPI